jgi:hypothetical protein
MGRMCIVSKRGRYADKCHVKKLYHSRPEPPAQFPCSSPSSTVSLRNCQALLIPTLLRLRSASDASKQKREKGKERDSKRERQQQARVNPRSPGTMPWPRHQQTVPLTGSHAARPAEACLGHFLALQDVPPRADGRQAACEQQAPRSSARGALTCWRAISARALPIL